MVKLQIDSTFDLNDSQDDFVKNELSAYLKDLNKSEIPVLQRLLTDASRSLRDDISENEVAQFFKRWNDVYTQAMIRASIPVGQFLSTLQPEQRERWKKEQEKKHRDKLEELSEGSEKFNETRRRKLITQLGSWIGALNGPQLQTVSEFAQKEYDWSKRELSARKRSQENFLKMLTEAKNPQTLAALFLQQQTPPYSQLDPEHLTLRQERSKQWIQLFTSLAQKVTSEQKRFFEKESQSLAIDLALIGASSN
ncbi:MAG: hypothetical protein RLZZ488_1779 [Pseudomonadota bacterium]